MTDFYLDPYSLDPYTDKTPFDMFNTELAGKKTPLQIQEIGVTDDAHSARHFRRPGPRRGQRRFGEIEPFADVGSQFIGGGGGGYPLRMAFEQLSADGTFKTGDMLRDRRLGQVERARCAADRTLPIDFDKGAQAAQHSVPIKYLIGIA